MSQVKIKPSIKDVMLISVGGIRIELSSADYQAMLTEIDEERARRNAEADRKFANAQKRLMDSWSAIKELREILYEREEGVDYFFLRDKPDAEKLEAFLDKYRQLMDFE
ncbi:hypothetical protein [Chromobacterium haemolyticum]|uniref:hypothetical protein n=1 Tax=Chromobacterium haemolyticum TaxID=394935 RepID=UPI0005935FB4|nr:hypothetical protein [Chromobacterium haemolyticum]